MFKYVLAIYLLCISISNIAYGSDSIFESVVKVSVGRSFGTGNCINEDKDYVYILTNKHVVGNSKTASLKFYKNGYESVSIPAEIFWTAYRSNEPVDIALLRVKKTNLNGWKPAVISFEFDDKIYPIGSTVITIGCPEGTWPKASKGHIVSIENGCYKFKPTVIPGQSGSLLMNSDGTKAIGLIAWYENGLGKAMSVEILRKAAIGKPSNYYFKQPYNLADSELKPIPAQYYYYYEQDCGPDGCLRRPLFNGRNQQPRRPYQDQPELSPDMPNTGPDGTQIFPDYPGDSDDDFVPPNDNNTDNAPVIPQLENGKLLKLDERLTTLENSFKNHSDQHNKITIDMQELDKKIDSINTTVGQIKTTTLSLDAKIKDLEIKINEQKPSIDVITPGKLDDFLKTTPTVKTLETTYENLGKMQTQTATDTIKEISSINTRIDKVLTDHSSSQKELIAAVLANNDDPIEASNNVYYDFGQVALATGIPSAVLLLIGYWGKRLLMDYLKNLKNRLGGSVDTAPF